MYGHLRANLWLLFSTLVLCCGLYPLVLWATAQTAFRDQAEGSLLRGPKGQVVGSRLIAQAFSADEYFQPRPSAVSYNASASGASNWGASNYQLRDRVARTLGPIAKYGSKSPQRGQLVGPDVERWFQQDRYQGKPGIVAQWTQAHPTLAQNWVKADKANAAYVTEWQQQNPDAVANWLKGNPTTSEPKPEDLAVAFFEHYSKSYPGTWPSLVATEGKTEKRMERVQKSPEIQSAFFDMWRQEHPDVDLEEVPADLVMASASGLDPHITMKNARYQLDRVVQAWVGKTNADPNQVRQEITRILEEKEEAPLGGLVGVPLVNVPEVNLALAGRLPKLARKAS